jgi:hypothetical protein
MLFDWSVLGSRLQVRLFESQTDVHVQSTRPQVAGPHCDSILPSSKVGKKCVNWFDSSTTFDFPAPSHLIPQHNIQNTPSLSPPSNPMSNQKGKQSAGAGKGKKSSKPSAESKPEEVLQAVVRWPLSPLHDFHGGAATMRNFNVVMNGR